MRIFRSENPDGPYDPQMTLVMFKTVSGENIGSFIHFATHPNSFPFFEPLILTVPFTGFPDVILYSDINATLSFAEAI